MATTNNGCWKDAIGDLVSGRFNPSELSCNGPNVQGHRRSAVVIPIL